MKGAGKDILFGIAVGEAIGLPFESSQRSEYLNESVTAYAATIGVPSGIWSHSSALTFCMAESVIDGYDLERTATNFIMWKNESSKQTKGYLFDPNNPTVKAIDKLEKLLHYSLENKSSCSYNSFFDNSNGSLMRILPLLYLIRNKPIRVQFDITWDYSALTHGHIRAAMCCMIYLKMAEYLLNGHEKSEAYQQTRQDISGLWDKINYETLEAHYLKKVILSDIQHCSIDAIRSGEYVVEALEASLWCLLKTDSYKDAVLQSIYLGGKTGTIGAITGGLAGLYYGYASIPDQWTQRLSKRNYIIDLATRLDAAYAFTS